MIKLKNKKIIATITILTSIHFPLQGTREWCPPEGKIIVIRERIEQTWVQLEKEELRLPITKKKLDEKALMNELKKLLLSSYKKTIYLLGKGIRIGPNEYIIGHHLLTITEHSILELEKKGCKEILKPLFIKEPGACPQTPLCLTHKIFHFYGGPIAYEDKAFINLFTNCRALRPFDRLYKMLFVLLTPIPLLVSIGTKKKMGEKQGHQEQAEEIEE